MKYIVKGNIQHNGEKFVLGDEITLTEAEARPLLSVKMIEKATAKSTAAVKKEVEKKAEEKKEEKEKEESDEDEGDDTDEADEDEDDSDKDEE